jgi:hypothetical protein
VYVVLLADALPSGCTIITSRCTLQQCALLFPLLWMAYMLWLDGMMMIMTIMNASGSDWATLAVTLLFSVLNFI